MKDSNPHFRTLSTTSIKVSWRMQRSLTRAANPATFRTLGNRLERRGQVALTSGDEEIAPGVATLSAPGHTPNHQIVTVKSDGLTACFLADLVPTPSHLKTHYVMGFDLDALTAMKNKERVLKQAQAENWLLIFEHSSDIKAGYLTEDLKIEPVELASL